MQKEWNKLIAKELDKLKKFKSVPDYLTSLARSL